MKPKPIVLATDGSPSAAEATLQAVELARELGTHMVVVAVEHVPVPTESPFDYADALHELTARERARVETTLASACAVATEAAIVSEAVHATGRVCEAICRVARARDARMIVIGAHRWGAAGSLLHGSVSTAVAHAAPCPVLIVHGGPEPQVTGEALPGTTELWMRV